jgi:hypothetical protein
VLGLVPNLDPLDAADDEGAGAEPGARRLRRLVARMGPQERAGALALSEMAPMDADRGLDCLAHLLPPAAEEVLALFAALSAHQRRALAAAGELRAAWAASRRGMLSVPAQVDAERRFRMRVGADGDVEAAGFDGERAEEAGAGAGAAFGAPLASRMTDADCLAMSGGVVSLGEGKVALEHALANANLRARVLDLERRLADALAGARGAGGGGVAVGGGGDGDGDGGGDDNGESDDDDERMSVDAGGRAGTEAGAGDTAEAALTVVH